MNASRAAAGGTAGTLLAGLTHRRAPQPSGGRPVPVYARACSAHHTSATSEGTAQLAPRGVTAPNVSPSYIAAQQGGMAAVQGLWHALQPNTLASPAMLTCATPCRPHTPALLSCLSPAAVEQRHWAPHLHSGACCSQPCGVGAAALPAGLLLGPACCSCWCWAGSCLQHGCCGAGLQLSSGLAAVQHACPGRLPEGEY